jgi:hypothetical protein
MSTAKAARPPFQSVELDPIDARLEARAAEKGIPTLVAPAATMTRPPPEREPPTKVDVPAAPAPLKADRGMPIDATPRSRMKSLKIELPDYAWIELKKRSAENMVSLRFFIMDALRAKGIPINPVDMVEDGRRFRD